MGTKPYPKEFRADAVALYLSDPAKTYAAVGRDLGVHPETLRLWVRLHIQSRPRYVLAITNAGTAGIGPVLHPDDAVAGKMDALFNRWAPRDYLDIDAILGSGRYSQQQLITIATYHNPGFDSTMFAESLSFLRRIPDRDFTAYGIDPNTIVAMRERFAGWEHDLTS